MLSKQIWGIPDELYYLNHGGFGFTTLELREYANTIKDELETNPNQFFTRTLPERLPEAKKQICSYLNCGEDELVLVDNVTTGFNAILNSLQYEKSSDVVLLDTAHRSIKKVTELVCKRKQINVVEVNTGLRSLFETNEINEQEIVSKVLSKITDKTRLVILDHATALEGFVLPLSKLINRIGNAANILVDGAHGPGMLDIDLQQMKPTWYVGNCHKWLGTERGCGFIWKNPNNCTQILPTVITHTYKGEFTTDFLWQGTKNYIPYLTVPKALQFREQIGEKKIRRYCRDLAREAKKLLENQLPVWCEYPNELLGNMVLVVFPQIEIMDDNFPVRIGGILATRFGIEVSFGTYNRRLCVRLSCYLYNSSDDILQFIEAMTVLNIGVNYKSM